MPKVSNTVAASPSLTSRAGAGVAAPPGHREISAVCTHPAHTGRGHAARLLAWPESIQHSQMFHLRPFNSQHCQIPVTNGRGKFTPEFEDYIAFVEDLFALWLRGPRPGNTLWTCPELGCTHGYHVSTNPHPWPDAVAARGAFAKAVA